MADIKESELPPSSATMVNGAIRIQFVKVMNVSLFLNWEKGSDVTELLKGS